MKNSKSQRSVGTNVVLNIVKSVSQLFLPLITYPYLLRVLGVENIGKVSYGAAIISYFSLFAVLGTNTYAVREGSRIRDDKNKINEFASQIFFINVIFSFFSYILLILLILFDDGLNSYKLLLLIQSVGVVSSAISFEWVNSVFEDYLYITLRSILVNLIQIAVIFIFIHKRSDYYWYAGIQTSAVLLVSFINWIYCKRYISITVVRNFEFAKHIKSLFVLFSNNIAVQIYMNIDTVMLGILTTDRSVGLYSAATKIYSLVKNILASIYIVPLSRMSYYYANGKKSELKRLYTNIVSFLSIIIIPAATGMFVLAKGLMYLLGGPEYFNATFTLKVLSISFIFALYGGVITQCYNIVIRRERINLQATTLSAIIDFGINLLVIRRFEYNGAAFTTLLAEAFVLIYCFIKIPNKKELFVWKDVISSFMNALIGAITIIFVSFILQFFVQNLVIYTFFVTIISAVIYFIELIILKDKTLNRVLSQFLRIYKLKSK